MSFDTSLNTAVTCMSESQKGNDAAIDVFNSPANRLGGLPLDNLVSATRPVLPGFLHNGYFSKGYEPTFRCIRHKIKFTALRTFANEIVLSSLDTSLRSQLQVLGGSDEVAVWVVSRYVCSVRYHSNSRKRFSNFPQI